MLTASSTLKEFYTSYYVPICLHSARPRTLEAYEGVLKHWCALTGNPPLRDITPSHLAQFVAALADCPGKQPGSKMSPNTVRMVLRHIQAILDGTGPPVSRSRDAAGILDRPPWVRPPRERKKITKRVPADSLRLIYDHAGAAKVPLLPSCSPSQWWQSLIVFLYNSGLRIGETLDLNMVSIAFSEKVIRTEPESSKTYRGQEIPLNATTIEHLRMLNPSYGGKLFDWPYHKTHLYTVFYEIQSEAGIRKSDRFGFHEIRRTTGTVLWETSPQAAQLALGHATSQMTRDHYVDRELLVKAVEAMPQPWATGGAA